jgi:hypothetical protein
VTAVAAKTSPRLVAGLLAAAVTWLFLSPWHGPVVVALSDSHGIDAGDLPAVALIAVAVALVRSRPAAEAETGPWMRAGRTLPAAVLTLGALLILAGLVQAYANPSLLPAGGGTFAGATRHADSRLRIAVGRWVNLAVTYDGDRVRLYLDGVAVSGRTIRGRLLHTRDPLWMGGNRPYGEYFKGDLDEVRVYRRALSAAEVRRDMSTPVARTRPAATRGLVAAYGLDAQTGRIAADRSGRANDGAIRGARWTPGGRFGAALSFDGSGDLVRIPASRSLDLTRSMTLSAWVRPSGGQRGWRTVLHRQRDAYFLDAGGGHLEVNTLSGLDDGQAALAALVIAWLCVALAAGGRGRRRWAAGAIALAVASVACVALAAPRGSALAQHFDGSDRSVALGVLFLAVGLFTVRDTGRACRTPTST